MAVSTYAQNRAKELMGGLDLSTFETQKNAAQKQYDTDSNSLTTQYNTLMNKLNKTKEQGREDFGSARATISENAFTKARDTKNDIASRLSGATTGLQQLGEIGNKIETGRQMSDTANKYYRALSDIVDSENNANTNYTQGKEKLSANLNSNLANIGSSEYQAKTNYTNSLTSLAMQIQNQMDNQAATAASRASSAATLTAAQKAAANEKGSTLLDNFKEEVAANPGDLVNLTKKYVTVMKGIGADDMIGALSGVAQTAMAPTLAQQLADRTAANEQMAKSDTGFNKIVNNRTAMLQKPVSERNIWDLFM